MDGLADMLVVKGMAKLERELKTKSSVVVLVYATWCPFCMRFLPVFQKYAKAQEWFILAEDNNEEIAEKYDLDIIPTVLIFEEQQIIKRLEGKPGRGLTEPEWAEFLRTCNI